MLKRFRKYRAARLRRRCVAAKQKGWLWAHNAYYRTGMYLDEIESHVFLPRSTQFNLLFRAKPDPVGASFDIGAANFIDSVRARWRGQNVNRGSPRDRRPLH